MSVQPTESQDAGTTGATIYTAAKVVGFVGGPTPFGITLVGLGVAFSAVALDSLLVEPSHWTSAEFAAALAFGAVLVIMGCLATLLQPARRSAPKAPLAAPPALTVSTPDSS